MKAELIGDNKTHLQFYCPGCKGTHTIPVGRNGSRGWGWNGDLQKPTITPSILNRSGHYVDHGRPTDECWCTYNAAHPEDAAPFTCGICHSFVTDGNIQFLNDCTHDLAGQTVSLPDLPCES